MRILVTGAAGFIGSHLCEALLHEGHSVVGLDAFVPYYPRAVKEANLSISLADPDFTFHELDLRTADLLPIVMSVDAVIHEAAMPGLPQSWTHFDAYAECNLLATQRLAEAARRTGLQRFVYISTSSVYGKSAVGAENAPLAPVSPYGVTKLAAENLLRAYADAFSMPLVVLRYFSVYGPRQRPDMAYHRFIRAMLDGTQITVFGDGSATRTSTYISDCVRGTIQALERGSNNAVYNLGGKWALSVMETIRLLAELVGVEPELAYAPTRPGDQTETRAIIDKARAELGYEPTVQPFGGLSRQVDWQRSHESRLGPSRRGADPDLERDPALSPHP